VTTTSTTSTTTDPRILKIELARLEGTRPRPAGVNARIGVHGNTVRPPVLRVTTDDGASGFGVSRVSRENAERLVGRRLSEVFSLAAETAGAGPDWIGVEYPLWDLMAKRAGLPAYAFAAQLVGRPVPPAPFRVPCYDTSLYIDDLHIDDNAAAAALIAEEAMQGFERSHRNFKIKVGRGGRWMDLEKGTQRDIAVIRAVRRAVGPDGRIMIDANNGYNLNLAKRVLDETADCRLFWIEEAFHEDAALYQDLHEWMRGRGIETLISDGEGTASPFLLDWARDKVVDILQYDYLSYGFTKWLATGRLAAEWGARVAPHHYGGLYGNYASGHLAGALPTFTMVEWDEATTPVLDASAYSVRDGYVTLPDAPGFGLNLDESAYQRGVQQDGFAITA
jgi:L-rhamnonate dehydratase